MALSAGSRGHHRARVAAWQTARGTIPDRQAPHTQVGEGECVGERAGCARAHLVDIRLLDLLGDGHTGNSHVADITGNVIFKKMWRNVYAAVKQGKKIQFQLSKSGLLPRSVVQMVAAGEESGRLGEVLEEVSAFYQKALRDAIKTVTGVIEDRPSCAELVARIMDEAEETLKRLQLNATS